MLQLEQESNLLEQSFLSYLERARAQKQRHNIRASYARERQQFHRTMDNFRDWKHAIPHDDDPPPPAPAPAAAGPSHYHDADLELELELQLGIEPDSYKFTNAIAEARHKLLSELHAPAQIHSSRPTPAQPAQSQQTLPLTTTTTLAPSKLVELDQVQSETQLLLHRVEATLARVSKPPSLQLQLALDPPSGATQTSLEQIGDGVASGKLQRSMAKMQKLFGYHATEEQQQPKQPATTLRPWSAPTSKLTASFLPSTRPHTAPSSLTDIVSLPLAQGAARVAAVPSNLLGLLDGLSDGSDTTANSSSLTSLDNRPMTGMGGGVGEVFTKLLANAGPTPSPSGSGSTSPSVSASLEFWRRMNL